MFAGCEDHNIILRNFPPCPKIPSAMDKHRASPNQLCSGEGVIYEPDVVDAAHRHLQR